ncbi:probable transcriptional regulator SLK3 isoform X2 [Ananas comosus]|nr:probable transcriptional regulator SLK3 isoform X2 [Ananas comosus]
MIQQLLQGQDQSPQLQALIQQQRLQLHQQQQKQQILQSIPQIQHAQIIQQQQKQQQLIGLGKRPIDSGICSRRIMQYLYHQRHRPADNSIFYWRKFVAEYFAPRARKRWCLSLYDDISNHALGAFPQTAVDAWHCDICSSKSGKGFEATFEILPRLCQIKFDRGVIDEHLFLDMPHECRLSTGIMILEYAKAVQESVYEHLRVVREGQLRIVFTPELKIMSWEFCARRHEEFLPRRFVAPQVNQLLQVAQKCQAGATESGSAGGSNQDLQSSCNMFVTSGRQLAKNLELQSLNDLGFSKRYVRCLQISEVVNSMKELMNFSREHKIGPIESLKNYPGQVAAKIQNQKAQEIGQQSATPNSLLTDQTTLNKITGIHPNISTHMNNNVAGNQVRNNPPQSAASLSNYQSLLKNLSPKQSALQQEALISASNGQAKPVQFHSMVSSVVANGLSGVNENSQQHVIQQLLQEVINNSRTPQQQSPTAPIVNGSVAGGDVIRNNISSSGGPSGMNIGSVRNSSPLGNISNVMSHNMNASILGNISSVMSNNMNASHVGNVPTNVSNNAMGRSNSFKSVDSNPTVVGESSISSRADLDLPELDQIAREFAENGLFNGEPCDMGYDWKM